MSVLLADSLTRIRNGQMAGLSSVKLRYSKLVYAVAKVMVKQGYLKGCALSEENGFTCIDVGLSYHDEKPVIKLIKVISKPSRKIYSSIKPLQQSFSGLGIKILSTSRGVMTDFEARKSGVGGEVLCEIF